ncbi:cell shape-determining protein MreC [Fibrobacterales bacterium]|nr:cell shape-determining protein MreC [Fibrobacterales bacterium]
MKFFQLIVQVCKWARGAVVFALLAVISLYMLNTNSKNKQNIADLLFSTVFYFPQSVTSYIFHFHELGEENEQLKKDNARLQFELNSVKEYEIENQRFKKLLAFENHWNYPITLTQIVGYNPGTYMTTAVVNSGEEDSISYGMPVFTVNGLVGRVSKVFKHHSMVQLLTDPNSRTSVISQRSRVFGTVFSLDNGTMQIQGSSYADLKPNDTLVTSGIGGVFPKGIPVGVLKKFDKNNDEVLSYGTVSLLQNIESLEEVFIIRKNMDWIVWE